MVFVLAGIGYKVDDVPIGLIKYARKIKNVFLETYTSVGDITLKDLTNVLGRNVIPVSRTFVEEELPKLIGREDIILMVYGNPFFATTHSSLIQECIGKGEEYVVLGGPSFFDYVGKLGLFIYKFGKMASIPLFVKTELPYNVLKENKSIGAHTLFILDLDVERKNFLNPLDALRLLLDIEERRREGVVDLNDKVIVCGRLGMDEEKVFYDTIKNLISKGEDFFGKPPFCIIYPSKLNPIEKEFLENYVRSLDY